MARSITHALLLLALISTSAHGAGLWLYEQGTPDVGTAAAGMAARADDAATAFANPAGMTRLKESQVMAGIQPIYGNMQFDTDAAYTYMDAGDAPVNQSGGPLRGSIKGDLERSAIHFFALNANWRF